jgi:peptide/nickel transport system ATP-binding protein/oligopeptide transport system ATP-binding protein
MSESSLIETVDLRKVFRVKEKAFSTHRSELVAVDGVSLKIEENETLGLVGESGCGKSTLGRAILMLNPATSGEVRYQGEVVSPKNKAAFQEFRKNAQLIFQDPYASLNPKQTLLTSVRAPLDVHKIGTSAQRDEAALELLSVVGLSAQQAYKYPHELSGGQRQRAVIARAMILNPKFIVCDEPVSALDVSIRSQVLNLMKSLQQSRNISYLFISHDLSVVRYLCTRVAVMYLGRIVEYGTKDEIFNTPVHPYTKALMSAIPIPDVDVKSNRIILEGDVPSPIHPPAGCHFHTRCPYADETCAQCSPTLDQIGGQHCVACHKAQQFLTENGK